MADTLDAAALARWVGLCADRLEARSAELSQLDAAIGDGDHGANMARGFRAVRERVLAEPGAPDQLLKDTGMTLLSTVGGASGPLFGTLFMRMAGALAGATEVDLALLIRALGEGVEGVRRRGRAEAGDKTMLDALLPALESLRADGERGAALGPALQAAARAAEEGCRATIPMVASRGRASYLGERSLGHQDPGATSAAAVIAALAAVAA
ncbi:MAG TPA: dihydroxyacetone kinase subunit DhaL [Candidatus Dormibacteraeota bacterium]|jgi:dihydroxyacetone kinase-like protein|nr:dihydroxyacetone kinase subunit DhaL [Candidatus Dormibacteraeota bacterium]